MNPITLTLPTWAFSILGVLGALWAIATVIANSCTSITPERLAVICKQSPRIGWLIKFGRHAGSDLIPATNALINLIRGAVHLVPAALVLFVFLVGGSVSCSASQTVVEPDGAVIVTPAPWVGTAEVALHDLQTYLPAIASGVTSMVPDSPGRAAALVAITVAQNSLPGLEQALADYSRSPTVNNLCIAHAAIAATAATATGVAEAIGVVGFMAPAIVLMAIGGLASLIDELIPACVVTGDASAAPSGVSLRMRLSGLPSNLRSLPLPARVRR